MRTPFGIFSTSMRRISRFAVVAGSVVVAACTTEVIQANPNGGQTPRDASSDTAAEAAGPCSATVPASCPTPVPSFANDIAPIFTEKCNGCHTGGDGPWPLTNYLDVFHWRTQVLSELAACTMPPSDAAAKLTRDERATVIAWLVCDAPEN